MPPTNACTHGLSNETLDNLSVRGVFNARAVAGIGLDGGSFTVTAAGTTTITDANVVTSSLVQFSPTNGPAGLLVATKTCYIGAVSAGSFTFLVSATGAGAPAGTETFSYVSINHTDLDA